MRAVLKNPPGYDFYVHDETLAEKITAASLVPVKTATLPGTAKLQVIPSGQFYEVSGSLLIKGQLVALKELSVRYTYFIFLEGTLYLPDNLQLLRLTGLFKKKQQHMLVHTSKFKNFRSQFLNKLEDSMKVEYGHIKPASRAQLKQQGFDHQPERIIYLSDFGNQVMIIPVLRYGEAEIPVRTKRQIHGIDKHGKEFLVKRDPEAELFLISLLVKQHPYLEEQLENGFHYFDLHKKHFLNEAWFLNAFDEWQQQQITVLGFNELEGNKLNPHKVNIDIKVISGINWFNAAIQTRFGKKKATLKQVHTAIRHKSKYVQLDDGTLGILPEAWIDQFTAYFHAGEISDEETLQIPKINFNVVEALFSADLRDEAVNKELILFREKLQDFKSIRPVRVPPDLKASLRPYQQEGLNWLNFLDDFNFGGCLADDMGLGKTIQIIAFILSQRAKVKQQTNLVIVPATLIFNWQAEVAKFAPSIRLYTLYGAERAKDTRSFDDCEIILTSYTSVLSDVNFLKNYQFNYIFLDESQQIKNPESQRYRAVRLLQSRNKIVITGTPVENNTYDLYSQFSFACPGLLGSKRYFRDIYSQPVDQFKNSKRAAELQQQIKPFILRRTKQQVAAELPEKTEMLLYCPMQPAQRAVYDAYEKEFREFISVETGDEIIRSPMHVLKGLIRLRQICDSPALLGDQALNDIGSSKVAILVEEIEGKAPQHKILVFSQFVSMLDLLKKELTARSIRFACLTGSTRNRESEVNTFQNDSSVRVFLISLKAGGTGLNLTEADYIYLADPWWNPAVENQAIDRSHRIGQTKKVVAVRLICPDTVEEKMMAMQQSKRQLAHDLIGTEPSFFKSLTKDDLLSLLS